jgi:hypothetical protein
MNLILASLISLSIGMMSCRNRSEFSETRNSSDSVNLFCSFDQEYRLYIADNDDGSEFTLEQKLMRSAFMQTIEDHEQECKVRFILVNDRRHNPDLVLRFDVVPGESSSVRYSNPITLTIDRTTTDGLGGASKKDRLDFARNVWSKKIKLLSNVR